MFICTRTSSGGILVHSPVQGLLSRHHIMGNKFKRGARLCVKFYKQELAL